MGCCKFWSGGLFVIISKLSYVNHTPKNFRIITNNQPDQDSQHPLYNFDQRRQNNCQIKRQIETQIPNERKLRTCTRYKIIVQINAIICP